jgi:putative hydrolase of the HAD superfamily
MGSTLAGLTAPFIDIYHRVFQRHNLDIPIGEVEQAVVKSWDQVGLEDSTAEYERSLEANRRWQREVEQRVMDQLKIHPDIHEDLFWKLIEAFEDPATYKVYDDVLGTLKQLKANGYRLGIISNWSWHLPELCEQLGLASYFDYIATSARVGFPKPRREIFLDALQGLKADPARSVHIGDTYTADILGAWSVGIAALWLCRPGETLRFAPEGRLNALQNEIRIESLYNIWPYLDSGIPLEKLD